MKNLIKIAFVGTMIGGVIACNSPQEKAQNASETAASHADAAANRAANAENVAVNNAAAAILYSDIAAANNAVSTIQTPALEKNESKDLAKSLAELIIKRINATTVEDATKAETNIAEERSKINQKALDNKITTADRDAILKYGDDMVAAAKTAAGLQ